jgi:hypothetical protein
MSCWAHGEQTTDPSPRLYESERRFGRKQTKTLKSCLKSKELHKTFKTTSGSQSGLDTSIQAKKHALKSHATVPLSKEGVKFKEKPDPVWWFSVTDTCFPNGQLGRYG